MVSVARAFLFVLGWALGFTLLLVLEIRYDHSWMPIAFGAALILLTSIPTWRPDSRFLVPYAIATPFLVFASWLYSERNVQPWIGPVPKFTFEFACGLGTLFLVIALVGYWTMIPEAKRIGRGFLILLALGVFIGYISSPAGGPDIFTHFFRDLCHFGPDKTQTAVLLTRKTIHFVFYGTAGWVAFRTAWRGDPRPKAALAFGLVFAFSLASFDEMRQTTAYNRTGSPWDVLLDLSGATTFCLVSASNRVRSQAKAQQR